MRRSGTLSGRFGVVFAPCLLLLTGAPVEAGWHRVDTPNFVVIGEEDASALHDIAVRFEAFRETLTRLLSERATATAVPTIVIVFPSERAFTPFKPRYHGKAIALGGLFVPGPDVNYIAIVNGGNGAGLRIVFHEYAHLVFANAARRLPAWLNEGLAEYYSTFELGRDGAQVTIGRPIGDHLEMLERGPIFRLEALVRIDYGSPIYNEGERRSIFYAQSWALTHLILHGEPRRSHLLHAYLAALWEGASALDAWHRTFGGEKLDRELVRYVRRRVFKAHRFTFTEKLTTIEPAAMPLVRQDAEAFLADLLLQQHRLDEADDRLAASAEAGGSTPWPSTVRALLDLARKEYATAEGRLLRLDPGGDWLTAYRAGVALSNLVADNGVARDRHLAASRRLFAAARARRTEWPHAVASRASLELQQSGEPSPDVRSALAEASRRVPGRHDYVLLQARLLARQAAFGAARNLLAPLMAPGYSRDVRDAARRLMGDIVTVEAAADRGARWDAVHGPAATCCASARQIYTAPRIGRELPLDLSLHTRGDRLEPNTICQR